MQHLCALGCGGLIGAEGGDAAREGAEHAGRTAEDAEVAQEAERDAHQLPLCARGERQGQDEGTGSSQKRSKQHHVQQQCPQLVCEIPTV